MRIRVFPADFEGTGSYRILYPYGTIDTETEHTCLLEGVTRDADGRVLFPVPESMVGYEEPDAAGMLAQSLFLDSDVYVFQNPMQDVLPGVIVKLKIQGKRVVVDIDDWLFGIPPTHKAKSVLSSSRRESLKALDLCLRMADLVTCSTQALADEISKKNQNVVVLRNRLGKRHVEGLELSYEKERPDGKVHIGWMGYMGMRDNDLKLLKPWLNKFLKEHPQVMFVNVGDRKALDYLCVPKDRRIHLDGMTFPGHFQLAQQIDIGLVPLARSMFNESKSYLKGLEYGAVGATLIATPTAEYQRWENEGDMMDCCTASTADEWFDQLSYLVHRDRWRMFAKNNHKRAMAHLIEDNYEPWLEALECTPQSAPLQLTAST